MWVGPGEWLEKGTYLLLNGRDLGPSKRGLDRVSAGFKEGHAPTNKRVNSLLFTGCTSKVTTVKKGIYTVVDYYSSELE